MGGKTMFAPLLQEVTGVDKDVLTSRVALSSIPVGERMRWASTRTTTRVEDQAYSLMGIFGIHMSTIYGEGSRAFRRLQEEIMKQSSDHTLFTWGLSLPFRSTAEWSVAGISRAHHDLLASSPAMFNVRQTHTMRYKSLQASTVLEFSTVIKAFSLLRAKTDYTAAIRTIFRGSHGSDNSSSVLSQMPEVTVTGLGIRIRAPAVDIVDRKTSVTIALLMCNIPGSPFLIGLVLHRIPHSSLYGIGFTVRSRYFRYVYIDPSSPIWRSKLRWRGPTYQLAGLCSANPYYEPRLAMEVVVAPVGARAGYPQTSPDCTQSSHAGDGWCQTPHVSEWTEVPPARAREKGALGLMRVRRFGAVGTDAVVRVDLYVTNLSANYEDRHVWAIEVEVEEAHSRPASWQQCGEGLKADGELRG
ncbi:hypothetical protein C8Q80DRAFT_1319778 [Daedaleopsis nitida]|nr:hypothetical protein C8Q80DRAFT_1319778 [Daedaleopsis nitida]